MSGPPTHAVFLRRRILLGVGAAALALGGATAVASLGDGSDAGRVDAPAAASTTSSAPGDARPNGATTTTTAAPGVFAMASGDTGVVGVGRTYRYTVEVETATGVDVDDFAEDVHAILGDRRGWVTADLVSFQRVGAGPADFTVRLATPRSTDLLCLPLDTHGDVSCGHNAMAVINLTRWEEGAAASKLDLADYRAYLITHEVGHLIGHHHEACPGPGQRATTMMQQTYTIGDCTPNPWPAPDA